MFVFTIKKPVRTQLVARQKMIAKELLFTSSRTMNRNQVVYFVQYDTLTGAIYAPEPIVAEWNMLEVDASGSTREALTLMERELLYGVLVVKQDHNPPRVTWAISGLPDLPITVFQRGPSFVAGAKLPSGHLGLIKHVHGLMEGNLIKGLEITAVSGAGAHVFEYMPINRTMAA